MNFRSTAEISERYTVEPCAVSTRKRSSGDSAISSGLPSWSLQNTRIAAGR